MPLYEYRCPECEYEFDEKAGFDDPNPPCPKCGVQVKKKVSMPTYETSGIDNWNRYK